MAGIRRSIVVAGLAACVAALGYANYRLSTYAVDTTPTPVGGANSTAGKDLADKDMATALTQDVRSAGEFPETTARPIFFSGRRVLEKSKPKIDVVEVKPADVAVGLPPPEPLRLFGIMGAGSGRSALVRTMQDPQGVWMAAGDEYRGWKLREIFDDKVVVEAQGERRELRLYSANAKAVSH